MVTSPGAAGNKLPQMTFLQRVRSVFMALSVIGISAACAPMGVNNMVDENAATRMAIQNAEARGDHYALAKHFEDAAKSMEAKAEEQKALLKKYESMRLYGWQSHNLKSRTSALIRKYEQAVRSNVKEAVAHRQMARRVETAGTM